jgi:thiosulfate/3-mercaptopyruvate sulfurtransferase
VEFVHPEYLVTSEWLAEHLDDPAVVVLDVTAKLTSRLDNEPARDLWAHSHVPGSQFFDIASAKGALSDPDASLPWTWPRPEQFAATMAAYGVDADSRVVLVARTPRPGVDSGTMWCTRAWWTMHHFGVTCAILEGGIEQWEAEQRPLATGTDAEAIVSGREPRLSPDWARGRASRDDVLAAVESGGGEACVIDALPVDSFEGHQVSYGRPGHIAGAVNVPFVRLIERETCAFVDADTMYRALDDAGAFDASTVITYCGGAIAATVDAFCLALLGHDQVSVYDGSLMEWAADPTLPMIDPSG